MKANITKRKNVPLLASSLGNILPTLKSLALSDKWAKDQAKTIAKFGEEKLGRKFEKRYEEGEIRYYDGNSRYAIIGRNLNILWFEKKKDGWYAIKQNKA